MISKVEIVNLEIVLMYYFMYFYKSNIYLKINLKIPDANSCIGDFFVPEIIF